MKYMYRIVTKILYNMLFLRVLEVHCVHYIVWGYLYKGLRDMSWCIWNKGFVHFTDMGISTSCNESMKYAILPLKQQILPNVAVT